MIYLRRNDESASTNDEGFAQKLEEKGYVRLTKKEVFLKKIVPNALGNSLAVGLGVCVFAVLPGSTIDCGIACCLTLTLWATFEAVLE